MSFKIFRKNYCGLDVHKIAIWHILSDLKPYTADGFLEQRPVNESKVLTTSQALNLLKQRGYVIKDNAITAS